MTIYITDWFMTSDITPETAGRSFSDPDEWRLSWLPERSVSFAQAHAGMELDEIVSDPASVYDRVALARAVECADVLGILWEQAVVRLYKRMMTRNPAETGTGHHVPPYVAG